MCTSVVKSQGVRGRACGGWRMMGNASGSTPDPKPGASLVKTGHPFREGVSRPRRNGREARPPPLFLARGIEPRAVEPPDETGVLVGHRKGEDRPELVHVPVGVLADDEGRVGLPPPSEGSEVDGTEQVDELPEVPLRDGEPVVPLEGAEGPFDGGLQLRGLLLLSEALPAFRKALEMAFLEDMLRVDRGDEGRIEEELLGVLEVVRPLRDGVEAPAPGEGVLVAELMELPLPVPFVLPGPGVRLQEPVDRSALRGEEPRVEGAPVVLGMAGEKGGEDLSLPSDLRVGPVDVSD